MRRNGSAGKKFEVPLDPLQEEMKLRDVQPLPANFDKQLIALAERHAAQGGDEDVIAAGMVISHVLEKQFSTQIGQEFLKGFWLFLMGKQPPKQARKCVWGNQPLFDDPQVRSYLDLFITKRQVYKVKLAALKQRVPQGLVECYLYYKYIVCADDEADDNAEFPDTAAFLLDWDKFVAAFDEDPRTPLDPEHPWVPRPYWPFYGDSRSFAAAYGTEFPSAPGRPKTAAPVTAAPAVAVAAAPAVPNDAPHVPEHDDSAEGRANADVQWDQMVVKREPTEELESESSEAQQPPPQELKREEQAAAAATAALKMQEDLTRKVGEAAERAHAYILKLEMEADQRARDKEARRAVPLPMSESSSSIVLPRLPSSVHPSDMSESSASRLALPPPKIPSASEMSESSSSVLALPGAKSPSESSSGGSGDMQGVQPLPEEAPLPALAASPANVAKPMDVDHDLESSSSSEPRLAIEYPFQGPSMLPDAVWNSLMDPDTPVDPDDLLRVYQPDLVKQINEELGRVVWSQLPPAKKALVQHLIQDGYVFDIKYDAPGEPVNAGTGPYAAQKRGPEKAPTGLRAKKSVKPGKKRTRMGASEDSGGKGKEEEVGEEPEFERDTAADKIYDVDVDAIVHPPAPTTPTDLEKRRHRFKRFAAHQRRRRDAGFQPMSADEKAFDQILFSKDAERRMTEDSDAWTNFLLLSQAAFTEAGK